MPARSSRKRGRRARDSTGPRPTGAVSAPAGPDGQAATRPGGQAAAQPGGQAAAPGPRRPTAEERNEAIRATLTPLEPGERPLPLKIAVVIALLIGVADLIQVAVSGHVKVGHTHASFAGVALFSVLMFICAAGMWQLRYWAVLGFQALLALVIVAFSLVLLTANDILRVIIALAVIGGGGVLFFKLVRVLSRLQLPTRPGER